MANSPGDYTGIQKQKLAAQHAEEQQKRASEMAMVTAAAETQKSREVVDYTKPRTAPPVDTGPVDYTEPQDDEESDPTIDAIVAASRGDDEEASSDEVAAAEQMVAQRAAVQPVSPQTVQKQSVLVRARYDLEQVTIGHGNNYDFEEGRQYRVPPNVANHLAERSMVDVLG